MTDPEALEAIRSVLNDWNGHKIEYLEALARIAEALEATGRELIGKAEISANEP